MQDDNAHAWAEIYLSGQGWTPLEVTPGMTAELTEGELAADAAQAGQNAADSDTPLPARQEADSPAEAPQSVPLLWVLPTVLLLLALALALLRRARRTPLQTVQAEFCALHRKMRRCGLAAEVSSDEAAFAEFLQTHCPQTDRETVQHLLDAVQAAQFAPDPCTAETAQEIQTLCRKLRKTVQTNGVRAVQGEALRKK